MEGMDSFVSFFLFYIEYDKFLFIFILKHFVYL